MHGGHALSFFMATSGATFGRSSNIHKLREVSFSVFRPSPHNEIGVLQNLREILPKKITLHLPSPRLVNYSAQNLVL